MSSACRLVTPTNVMVFSASSVMTVLPSSSGSARIQDILGRPEQFIVKLNAVPIAEVGDSILAETSMENEQIGTLSSSQTVVSRAAVQGVLAVAVRSACPCRTLPKSMSLPLPPVSASLPPPPSSTSLPLPPLRVSFPARPRMASLPLPPSRVSFPVAVAVGTVPVTTSSMSSAIGDQLTPDFAPRELGPYGH